MDEVDLRHSSVWGLAVWGLRVLGAGLSVVVTGLVALVWSEGVGQVILAVGMTIYLAGVLITVVGIALVYRAVRPLRPNFLQLRWSLLADSLRGRRAFAEPWPDGAGPFGERRGQPPNVEELRRSDHWKIAIWAVRAMGGGLTVVLAGLISLLWSAPAGTPVLVGGVAIYLLGVAFMMLEVRRAYGEVPAPRPDHARVQRILLHDALHVRSQKPTAA